MLCLNNIDNDFLKSAPPGAPSIARPSSEFVGGDPSSADSDFGLRISIPFVGHDVRSTDPRWGLIMEETGFAGGVFDVILCFLQHAAHE